MKFSEHTSEVEGAPFTDNTQIESFENMKLQAKNMAQFSVIEHMTTEGLLEVDEAEGEDVVMIFIARYAQAFNNYYATTPAFRNFSEEHGGNLHALDESSWGSLVEYLFAHPKSETDQSVDDESLSKYITH
jgi:hypothetical protein